MLIKQINSACKNNHLRIANYLLSHSEIDTLKANIYGQTPLDLIDHKYKYLFRKIT